MSLLSLLRSNMSEDSSTVYFACPKVQDSPPDEDSGRSIMGDGNDIFEAVFTKVSSESSSSLFVMTVKNISPIIELQSLKLNSYYEEAMLATVGHEQLNPLNSIITFSEYLLQKSRKMLDIDSNISMESSGLSLSESSTEAVMRMSDLKQQIKLLSCILNSSNQVRLLNSSMLNLNLIKQHRFEPVFLLTKNPVEILTTFSFYFKETMKEKKLNLKIERTVGGPRSEVLLKQGGLIEADLY